MKSRKIEWHIISHGHKWDKELTQRAARARAEGEQAILHLQAEDRLVAQRNQLSYSTATLDQNTCRT